MITLIELIDATTWLQPQDHIKVSLWDKSKIYEENEFEDITLSVKALAKYANFWVSDIDVEVDPETNQPYLTCMIWED